MGSSLLIMELDFVTEGSHFPLGLWAWFDVDTSLVVNNRYLLINSRYLVIDRYLLSDQ